MIWLKVFLSFLERKEEINTKQRAQVPAQVTLKLLKSRLLTGPLWRGLEQGEGVCKKPYLRGLHAFVGVRLLTSACVLTSPCASICQRWSAFVCVCSHLLILVAWFVRIGLMCYQNRGFNCEWFARIDSRESRCESPVPLSCSFPIGHAPCTCLWTHSGRRRWLWVSPAWPSLLTKRRRF